MQGGGIFSRYYIPDTATLAYFWNIRSGYRFLGCLMQLNYLKRARSDNGLKKTSSVELCVTIQLHIFLPNNIFEAFL